MVAGTHVAGCSVGRSKQNLGMAVLHGLLQSSGIGELPESLKRCLYVYVAKCVYMTNMNVD